MTKLREYLVALDVRSTLHAWIAAASEDDALRKAEDLYGEDDSRFTAKDGAINSAVVLETRSGSKAATPRRFRISFEQPPVHSIVVDAVDLDAAVEAATKAFLAEPGFFPEDPPAGWDRVFRNSEVVDTEEVQP